MSCLQVQYLYIDEGKQSAKVQKPFNSIVGI
jgi:hypothetical protein